MRCCCGPYLHWWRISDDPLARRIAVETADFLLRDLSTPEGGFAAALDADTDGVEGATYVWTPDELVSVLGADDAQFAASLLTVTDTGTFEDGRVDPAAARRPVRSAALGGDSRATAGRSRGAPATGSR